MDINKKSINDNVVFVLYTHRDVALAKILLETCNCDSFKIIVPVFIYGDEYGWKKQKKLRNNFTLIEKFKLAIDFGFNNIIFSFSIQRFKNILKRSDVVIDRGLTFFTIKPIARVNIALSLNRCYLNRILDVLPFYKEHQLKVYMHSDAWWDESMSGSFMMNNHSYEAILSNANNIYGVDILGHVYSTLEKIKKSKIKEDLNLPKDRKIVLLSFRMCADSWSIFSSSDEFILSVKENLIELKNKGYYVVSRRRMGKHDLAAYKSLNSPNITRFDEISGLVDQELNGIGGYPDLLYRLLYVSDILYLADISGIGYIEAALTRCPVYMPYTNKWKNEQIVDVNPALRNMIHKGLIFNNITEDNINYFNDNIENFLDTWYDTNVQEFWNTVLNK